MKKLIITIILILTTVFVVTPINTKALTVSDALSNSILILDKKDEDTSKDTEDIENWLDNDTDQEQDCEGTSDSLLGDPDDPDSVAWLLQQILNFIKIVGPILVVVLSSIDFVQVIVKSDDEAMAKAQKKLIKRLILAALLFFIPTLVEAILDIFGITSNSTCGIK